MSHIKQSRGGWHLKACSSTQINAMAQMCATLRKESAEDNIACKIMAQHEQGVTAAARWQLLYCRNQSSGSLRGVSFPRQEKMLKWCLPVVKDALDEPGEKQPAS
jgi:hypothetical protein